MLDQMFTGNAVFFTAPALLGTGVFVLRMGMLLMGAGDMHPGGMDLGGGHADFGHGDFGHADAVHSGIDMDSEPIDHGGTNTDSAFNFVSVQSIAAFLMGGGWGGISAYLGLGLSMKLSVLIAFGMGLVMLYIFAWLMKLLYDMQSSGNIDTRLILGQEAQVDVEVPSSRGGQGTVKIVINERMRRYRATTEGQTLHRGETVRVTKLNPDNTVSVSRT